MYKLHLHLVWFYVKMENSVGGLCAVSWLWPVFREPAGSNTSLENGDTVYNKQITECDVFVLLHTTRLSYSYSILSVNPSPLRGHRRHIQHLPGDVWISAVPFVSINQSFMKKLESWLCPGQCVYCSSCMMHMGVRVNVNVLRLHRPHNTASIYSV